ncbi:OmpH family outer membrane protein [Mesohalobacter halotolerans]|jgi:outer membrane protein|uniref:OmpH family outer membrane protein n=1 Tax=Mesohalobacter halotolerans TaxID=1883405 RepID=A0A4U5TQ30_9FLAO|nr:OmpH family outer membrane protein [Mesohalobacter halotolerans]MBS3739277.1 OmpH family outer membrane protein [Psychroflexus sp.]NBC57293.1 OmpH family outer membrane protein [Bacteroidota bacterium]TKS56279.1 OmpH family outer membrane protein [Mesohalobacter halotolerans]
MKIKFLIVTFVFTTISFAQTKVGTINTEYILSKMPEFEEVQKKLETYGKTLDTGLKEKFDEYQAKVKDYSEKESTYTEALKKLKQKDIRKLEEDIQKLRTNSSKLLQVRQDELLRPLYNEIGKEVEKIVKAEGFTQILNENNSLIYIDPEFDITLKVMKALGIPTEEQTTKN